MPRKPMNSRTLQCPDGYILITTGPLKKGDRVWDVGESKWRPQQREDAEILGLNDAAVYFGVARKAKKIRAATPVPFTAQYGVSRCKPDDSLYGPIHASMDANKTACGQDIDQRWMIMSNNGQYRATCKFCIAGRRKKKFLKTDCE